MADPGLLDRLPDLTVPVLVIWGEADRMISVEHGRAYAKAIPGARFTSSQRPGTCPSSRRRTGCSRRSGVSGLRRDHGRELTQGNGAA